MSTVKLASCIVRESDPATIALDLTYIMTFTETEVRLDLGFVATMFVSPSSFLTKPTRTAASGMTDSTAGYRIEVPVALGLVRPGGQSTITKSTTVMVAKNSLFVDLSPAQQLEEQTKSTTWQRPVWSKANAWDAIYAGIDSRLELNLDVSSAPKIESTDQRFVNRDAALALPPVTTTARSSTVGGTGGTAFEDMPPPNTVQINRLVTFGSPLTAIQIEWKDSSGQLIMGPVQGATTNPKSVVVFQPGEYITEVSGYHQGKNIVQAFGGTKDLGSVVDSIEILTNFKRQFGPFGAPRPSAQPYLITGLKVVGLMGRGGGSVNQLGFISRVDPAASAVVVQAPPIDTTDDLKGTITARGDNSPGEGKEKLFDNQADTKWLDFSPAGSWVQYSYPSGISGRLSSYTLTSAGDAPERDPANWQLLGSNDGGATWDTVDSQTGVSFSQRNQKLPFVIADSPTYKAYRLNITKVFDPSSASCVQLAEIELLGQLVSGQ